MSLAEYGRILGEFMYSVVLLAGVPLGVATILGLLVSFFQAVTQIQDQSLSLTIKIIAIVLVLAFYGPSLYQPLLTSTEKVFASIADVR